ncbi:Peroxisomal biogenesis factor 3 [Cladobotryum mycophilum]|uniref:Peroxisomal biogenesis factor 3 n=1 Tax=Cladobotryum mycophilum TaxID=491253 RepID=A0ABR0SDK1_9HYPO
MLSSVRRWMRQNRTPIAVGVGIVGAGYVVSQYVVSKINDARERMSSDRIAKENLRRRFEQNQEDCTFTVLALLPTATTNIITTLNTEQITYEIQQIKSSAKSRRSGESTSPPSIADTTLTEDDGKSMVSIPPDNATQASQAASPSPFNAALESQQETPPKARKTKRQLWDELTISAVTRSFTLVYTLALLTMFTRLQLNLLGRRSYLSSVIALATGAQQATISLENNDDDNTEQSYGSDFDTNRKYLTFSWWLLNQGWMDVMNRVESSVRTVFGSLSPRDLVTFERVADLTMEDKECEVIRESGILVDDDAEASPPALRRLLDETADLIESPAFSHIFTLLLDSGFSHLIDQKLGAEAFELPLDEAPSNVATTANLKRTRAILLPKILSVLTRQAHIIGNGVPNEYLQAMESVRDLEAFAAVVYSSNWENEVRDDGLMGSAVHIKPEDAQTSRDQTQVEGSVVIVDREEGFESAWGRATEKSA